MKICPECKFENNDNSIYCEKCGCKLEEIINVNDPNDSNNVVKQKSNNKALKIIGLIVSIIIVLYASLELFLDLTGISELHFKTTIILPAIMSLSLLASGIIGIIASTKLNKKFFISAISLFVVSVFLYCGCKIVNPMITTKDAAPANEDESIITEYKENCKTISYEELMRNPENNNGEFVKYIGKVVQIVSEGDYFSEYRIDITYYGYGFSDTVYVIFPHEEENNVKLIEDDLVSFYGTSSGMYSYTSALNSTVTLPRITARYMEINTEHQSMLAMFKKNCRAVDYEELKTACANSDKSYVKIDGTIVKADYYEDHAIYLVDVSSYSSPEQLIGVMYIDDVLLDTKENNNYTFYGNPDKLLDSEPILIAGIVE